MKRGLSAVERLVPSENFWLKLRCAFGNQVAHPASRCSMGARAMPADRAQRLYQWLEMCSPPCLAMEASCRIHASLRAFSIGGFPLASLEDGTDTGDRSIACKDGAGARANCLCCNPSRIRTA